MDPLFLILLIVLILCLAGVPWGGYAAWGWGPSGVLGVLLIVLLVVLIYRAAGGPRSGV